MSEKTREIRVLLHNIRSSHNVGSIFRTSDGVGVTRVYLSGYSPKPVDRFKRPNKEIAKTALGAECAIEWEYIDSFEETITSLKAEGFAVIGLEQDARSQDYRTPLPTTKSTFVLA